MPSIETNPTTTSASTARNLRFARHPAVLIDVVMQSYSPTFVILHFVCFAQIKVVRLCPRLITIKGVEVNDVIATPLTLDVSTYGHTHILKNSAYALSQPIWRNLQTGAKLGRNMSQFSGYHHLPAYPKMTQRKPISLVRNQQNSALQTVGRRFDPVSLHQLFRNFRQNAVQMPLV